MQAGNFTKEEDAAFVLGLKRYGRNFPAILTLFPVFLHVSCVCVCMCVCKRISFDCFSGRPTHHALFCHCKNVTTNCFAQPRTTSHQAHLSLLLLYARWKHQRGSHHTRKPLSLVRQETRRSVLFLLGNKFEPVIPQTLHTAVMVSHLSLTFASAAGADESNDRLLPPLHEVMHQVTPHSVANSDKLAPFNGAVLVRLACRQVECLRLIGRSAQSRC